MNKLERQRSTVRKAGFVPSLRGIGVWDRMVDDLRAGLDPFASAEPFVEALSGLQTRELQDADVFLRLFGGAAFAQ